MKIYNRFIAYTKRIISHLVYIAMLLCVLLLTCLYKALPEKSKSTNICAAIYFEDTNNYSDELIYDLNATNSIYTFKLADGKSQLIDMVKSGKVECGYYFPTSFFEDFIKGNTDANPLEIYTIPSTTLSASIAETIFYNITKITADNILINTVNDKELDTELKERLDYYLSSNEIFTLESSVSGKFSYEDLIYTINIPVYEITILFIIISALLGLLMFERDCEHNMFITLKATELSTIRLIAITTAVTPILLTGILSTLVMYENTKLIVNCLIFTLLTIISVFVLGLVIRKSTLLSKVLPLIAFLATIAIFIKDFI